MAYRLCDIPRSIGFFLLAGLSSGWAPAASCASEQLRFQVLLDDKKIGYHSFLISDDNGTQVVDIKARFDVKILFIPAYSYEHQNTEVWRDGCLHRIESTTDDNGEKFAVAGERHGHAFVVNAQNRSHAFAQECVMTFAYWNSEFLSQPRLLNAQTGEYIDVSVESLGERKLDFAAESAAEGFRISSGDRKLDISVWYGQGSGEWLALESRLGSGKLLRYLRVGASGRDAAGKPATPGNENG